jgi:tetratricopeptide (TPR) repeat protein
VNARPPEFVELARLLRRLDDAVSLRNSSLLHDVFAESNESYPAAENMALLRARAAILSAVATLDADPNGGNVHFSRQRTIVTRCDLRGEKHATVARELGVSLREFYRERRRAFARLLALIRANLAPPPQPVHSLPTRFELDMDHVANLRLVGDFKGVFAQLERIACEANHPEYCVRALCYGVEIAADIGDDARAREFFMRALNYASEIGTESAPTLAELDVQMACAYVGWQGTDVARASQSLERAATAVEQLPPAADRHDMRSAVGVLFRCAELASLSGNASRALTMLGRARRLLDRARHKPASMLGQLFLELGVVQTLVVGGMSRALEYALEALAIFESGQDPTGIADATGMLCAHLTACNDFSRAQRFGRTALQLAQTTGNAAEVADKALILSLATSLGGNPQHGLALARQACADARGGLFEVRGPLAVAEAYLRLGRPLEALNACDEVARYARDRGMLRYAGTASRLAADAHLALGNRASARTAADDAVAALEEHGHVPSLCRAYETANQLGLGGPASRLATELRATLRPAKYALTPKR